MGLANLNVKIRMKAKYFRRTLPPILYEHILQCFLGGGNGAFLAERHNYINNAAISF